MQAYLLAITLAMLPLAAIAADALEELKPAKLELNLFGVLTSVGGNPNYVLITHLSVGPIQCRQVDEPEVISRDDSTARKELLEQIGG